MRKIAAAIVEGLVCVLLFASTAGAVDYGGVGGRPAYPVAGNPRTQSIFVYTLKPGQSKTDGVRIINSTKQAQTIDVYPVDAELSSGGAFSCAQKAEISHGVGSWITMSKTEVRLQPGTNAIVPFTVTVPAGTVVGEHDGCIAIQGLSQTAQSSTKNGVVLSFRSAIRVAVTIPGKIVKGLTIQSVVTQRDDQGNIIVTPTVYNSGNVSLDTSFTTRLKPILGTGAGSISGTYPVLPHTTASWNFEVKKPFWGGWYRAKVQATYNSSPSSGLGIKGGTQKTISMSSGVLFASPAPGALAIEIIILLIILTLIVWLILHQQRSAHVNKRWQTYTVKTNDTLPSLAEARGTSWRRIARANKLKPPYHLSADQKLKLPPKD